MGKIRVFAADENQDAVRAVKKAVGRAADEFEFCGWARCAADALKSKKACWNSPAGFFLLRGMKRR